MTCPGRGPELDLLFTGGLEGPEAVALREHLDGCPLCRGYYDQLANVASMMENRAVPSFAVEMLEKRLMARLGVAAQPAPPAPVRLEPRRRRPWRPLLGLAAAAAVAALVIPLALQDEGGGEFTARSGGAARASFALKAFCIRDGKVSSEAMPGGWLSCPAGGAVQLAVTAGEPVLVRVSVRTAAGETLEPGGEIQVPAGADISLPISIPSSPRWLAEAAEMTVTVRGRSGQSAEHRLTITP